MVWSAVGGRCGGGVELLGSAVENAVGKVFNHHNRHRLARRERASRHHYRALQEKLDGDPCWVWLSWYLQVSPRTCRMPARMVTRLSNLPC